MKALPFPCIRPAQDRVLEALPAMGSILSGNDALRGAIADGLMLKDPGAAYYVYECSGEPGRVTGVVAICPVGALAGGDAVAADTAAAARAFADLKVQPRPVTLAYEASPVMDIILGAAKEGASLYAVTDPAGITHRVWEVKREDAVGAIRAMLDQAPEPVLADDPAYAGALVGVSQLLADEARSAGTYTGKEPFNFTVAALFPLRRSAAAHRRFRRVCSRTKSRGSSKTRPRSTKIGSSTNRGRRCSRYMHLRPFCVEKLCRRPEPPRSRYPRCGPAVATSGSRPSSRA